MQNFDTCPLFENTAHGFFSRRGGVSRGLYQSLNCGPGSNDDPSHVAENRRIVASQVSGRRDTPVLSCYQIHSAEVVVADDDWGEDRPKADAIVTNTPGLILGILTADCTPVLFSDPEAGVIGAAHAGWKGAISGVLQQTISAMETLGAHRKDIQAAIGPTIHAKSYEVTAEFMHNFLAKDHDAAAFFLSGKDEKHRQLNLPAYVAQILERAEINNFWQADIDTYESDDHFSYRRTTHCGEPDYGRQISAIMLKG